MKLSKPTLALLKNLSTINGNLLIQPGNVLATIATNKTISAEMEVEETFDTEFGIYDLSEFIGVLGIFEDPELEFDKKCLTISEGKNSIRYLPAEASVLVVPKKAKPFPADAEVSFDLPSNILANIVKSASVLKVPFVTIKGDGSKLSLVVHDKANANSNQFNIDIGSTDKEFAFHMKVDSLKMVPENYKVLISSKKVAKFIGTKKSYMLAMEFDSTYEG